MAEAQGLDGALLVSAERAAGLLSVSKAHLFRSVSCGRIPQPVRLGRRSLWRTQELRAWLAAGCPPMSKWAWGADKGR